VDDIRLWLRYFFQFLFLKIDIDTSIHHPPTNLFRKYQLKSSDTIQKALLATKDSPHGTTDWENLICQYESWIQELVDLSSESYLDQTKTMLYRQLVDLLQSFWFRGLLTLSFRWFLGILFLLRPSYCLRCFGIASCHVLDDWYSPADSRFTCLHRYSLYNLI
jgi:hypothetical protein